MLINIAQKKDFDALNATHRTSALCEVPFLKNKKKKKLKIDIFDHFDHFFHFFYFFLFLFIYFFFNSELVRCRELRFFALDSVHQTSSFELSKSKLKKLFKFFIQRGDPYDFGVVKSYTV